MVRRIKDFRFSYNLVDGDLEPVSSNYYPVTSAIKTNLHDNVELTDESLSILNDRSQGGACLNLNECELMIHRRTFVDDRYGVGEALDEQAFGVPLVARGKHLVFIGQKDKEAEWRRSLSQEMYMPPLLLFHPTDMELDAWLAITTAKEFRGLNVESLPSNIHILTLERWGDYASNEVLVRFEHLYEAGEHSELSSPATFQLTSDFFSTLTIGSVRETSLGGNVDIKKMQNERLKWNQKSDSESKPETGTSRQTLPLEITLEPMQIRTFILELTTANNVVIEVVEN